MATAAHSTRREGPARAKAPSRKDLTGPALRTFFRIADAWGLKEAEQMKLLGLDNRSTFQTWKRGAVAAIPKDALERMVRERAGGNGAAVLTNQIHIGIGTK